MKLLENIKAAKSSPETIATVMKMGKTISKVAVLCTKCDGFIGNRMLGPYACESKNMGEEGASPAQLDSVAVQFGMAMGPISLVEENFDAKTVKIV